jgi:hypothetical protein
MELRRYREAAAAFDTAFSLGLNSVYRETYRAFRDQAWELRDAGEGSSARIAEKTSITWEDFIELTKSETDLFRFLTAGRDWTTAELFNRLLERSFIPYTQDVTVSEWPLAKPSPRETVSRAGAAFYVWHLYAEHRADRGLLSRYSARYAARQNARSPVADIPLLSPFLDSVLGCVEAEFMALPDGRNFSPAERLRGSEALALIKKIK